MMLNTQSQSASIKEVDRPVVLSVEHVGKYFKLPTEQASGLKQASLIGLKASKATKNSMCFETSILKSTKVTSLEL